jgi:DNA-binding XRE family transcriptional regulator
MRSFADIRPNQHENANGSRPWGHELRLRDQARARQKSLVETIGVSREWIVEIEKGKPRAQVGLVLRALNILGIALDARLEIARQRRELSICRGPYRHRFDRFRHAEAKKLTHELIAVFGGHLIACVISDSAKSKRPGQQPITN